MVNYIFALLSSPNITTMSITQLPLSPNMVSNYHSSELIWGFCGQKYCPQTLLFNKSILIILGRPWFGETGGEEARVWNNYFRFSIFFETTTMITITIRILNLTKEAVGGCRACAFLGALAQESHPRTKPSRPPRYSQHHFHYHRFNQSFRWMDFVLFSLIYLAVAKSCQIQAAVHWGFIKIMRQRKGRCDPPFS